MRFLSFFLEGHEVYLHTGEGHDLPRQGDFVALSSGSYRVLALEWGYREEQKDDGTFECCEPVVVVHLRRLYPGEGQFGWNEPGDHCGASTLLPRS